MKMLGIPTIVLTLLSPALSSGCVDPLTSDAVERPELVLAAGSQVLPIAADAAKTAQIAAHDGLDTTQDGVVRASTGFWNGEAIRFFDFGESSATAIPLIRLVVESADGTHHVGGKTYAELPHPPIFDKVPGDAGYSPWWTVVLLPVTERYAGELLTSFAAVEEARREGLVATEVVSDEVVNCPVVAAEALLQRSVDGAPEAPEQAYYKGKLIRYFSFDHIHTDEAVVSAPPMYELRREGGEPISEAERGVDFTVDGDLLDTNDVFLYGPGDPEYTGFVRVTSVVVKAGASAVDTSGDDHDSDLESVDDLFDASGVARSDVVVAVSATGRVLNYPIAR